MDRRIAVGRTNLPKWTGYFVGQHSFYREVMCINYYTFWSAVADLYGGRIAQLYMSGAKCLYTLLVSIPECF